MNVAPPETLRTIRFQGELLPGWAQLLDLAAVLARCSPECRAWFATLVSRPGSAAARTVREHGETLRRALEEESPRIAEELQRWDGDGQPRLMLRAWRYALDTMIQQTDSGRECHWTVEGVDGEMPDDSAGGDVSLRRV